MAELEKENAYDANKRTWKNTSSMNSLMTRRKRLMAAIRGEKVDRPPVCFYELNGVDEVPDPQDPLNVFGGVRWPELIRLTREHSDRIVMRTVRITDTTNPLEELTSIKTWIDESSGSRFERTTITFQRYQWTQLARRDREIDTIWILEHFMKNLDDLKAWLTLPRPVVGQQVDTTSILDLEAELGETGIVMLDTGDPLCDAASLFEMGTYTILAYTEQSLFHQLVKWFSEGRVQHTERVARALPGRLWRIYGPEYASAPFLPPKLFHDYVVEYDRPLIEAIQEHGGYARLHSHGNLKAILPEILSLRMDGLDPLEPPPQGDMSLAEIRQLVGDDYALFGNIEVSEIETLPEDAFRQRIKEALRDGPDTNGSHFILMPTACPLGREISPTTLRNYEIMIEMAKQLCE